MAKFYLCKVCGNIVEKVEDSGIAPFCCAKKMTLLDPTEVDGAHEKHIPIVTVCQLPCDTNDAKQVAQVHVEIGSEPHPTQENHYIKWIELETNRGVQRHFLKAGEKPTTDFIICSSEKIINVYAYCNIHGLWASQKYN